MNLLEPHLPKPQYTAGDNIGITSSTCRHYTLINSIMCSDSYPIPILSLFFLYHPYIPPFLIRRIFHFLVDNSIITLTLLAKLTSAPFFSNVSTISLHPFWLATYRGVTPVCGRKTVRSITLNKTSDQKAFSMLITKVHQ